MMDEMTFDLRSARSVFSRIGFSLTAILVVGTVLQLLLLLGIPVVLGPENPVTGKAWYFWLVTFVPLYLAAIPTGLAMMRRLPAEAPPEQKLGFGNGLTCFLISIFVMYTGNLIGTMLSLALSGGTAVNAVAELAMENHPLKVLFMVVLAPILEELVCRKQLLDRTRCYGEKTAAVVSALTFGLLHQNFYQFFYAFGLGLIFAYIYLRTGRLRYSVILHAVINFMGSVLAPWMLKLSDSEALADLDLNLPTEELMGIYVKNLPGMLIFLGYSMLLFGLFIAGLVLFIIKCRNLHWAEGEMQLPRGTVLRTVCSGGMVVYVLLCLVMMVLSLL